MRPDRFKPKNRTDIEKTEPTFLKKQIISVLQKKMFSCILQYYCKKKLKTQNRNCSFELKKAEPTSKFPYRRINNYKDSRVVHE